MEARGKANMGQTTLEYLEKGQTFGQYRSDTTNISIFNPLAKENNLVGNLRDIE